LIKIFQKKKGFSFIEVMATACVLAFGLVAIYQAFFTSLNYLNHMTYRLHAMVLLDNKIEMIQKQLELKDQINVGHVNDLYSARINNRDIDYEYEMSIEDIENIDGVYQLSLAVKWVESAREIRISKTVYIFKLGKTEET